MKIIEITEASELVVRPGSDIRAAKQAQAQKPGAKQLGKGIFGTVFSNPGDVETVTKISKLHNDYWLDDGYYNYVDTLRKLSRAAKMNPYLPQIYRVRRFQSDSGKPYLETTMEKLTPLSQLTQEQAKIVLEKLAGEQYAKGHNQRYSWKDTLIQVINSFMSSGHQQSIAVIGAAGGIAYKIRDPQFKAAVKIINILGTEFTRDIHKGNVMFRMTSTGPQLVFSDPLLKTWGISR